MEQAANIEEKKKKKLDGRDWDSLLVLTTLTINRGFWNAVEKMAKSNSFILIAFVLLHDNRVTE